MHKNGKIEKKFPQNNLFDRIQFELALSRCIYSTTTDLLVTLKVFKNTIQISNKSRFHQFLTDQFYEGSGIGE